MTKNAVFNILAIIAAALICVGAAFALTACNDDDTLPPPLPTEAETWYFASLTEDGGKVCSVGGCEQYNGMKVSADMIKAAFTDDGKFTVVFADGKSFGGSWERIGQSSETSQLRLTYSFGTEEEIGTCGWVHTESGEAYRILYVRYDGVTYVFHDGGAPAAG